MNVDFSESGLSILKLQTKSSSTIIIPAEFVYSPQ
jgi:hypothetical protein